MLQRAQPANIDEDVGYAGIIRPEMFRILQGRTVLHVRLIVMSLLLESERLV